MDTPVAETSEPIALPPEPQTAPAAGPGQWTAARLLAVVVPLAFIVLGGAILASNLGWLAPQADQVVQVVWPAGVIVAGLWLIAAGGREWRASPTPFAVERGEAEQAGLVASAGTADVALVAGGDELAATELAGGEWTLRRGPRVETHDHQVTVRLEPGLGLPAVGGARWRLALGKSVPWRINLRSSTGNLDVDLTDLTVPELRLRSAVGDVDLKLPTAGGTELELSLAFGDLTVTVPDGVGVRVKLHQGPLAEVTHDERRFIRLAPDEVGTPLYAVAARRCTLSVWLGTGNLRLK